MTNERRFERIEEKIDFMNDKVLRSVEKLESIEKHLTELNGNAKDAHSRIDIIEKNQSKFNGMLIIIGAVITILINVTLRFFKM